MRLALWSLFRGSRASSGNSARAKGFISMYCRICRANIQTADTQAGQAGQRQGSDICKHTVQLCSLLRADGFLLGHSVSARGFISMYRMICWTADTGKGGGGRTATGFHAKSKHTVQLWSLLGLAHRLGELSTCEGALLNQLQDCMTRETQGLQKLGDDALSCAVLCCAMLCSV